MNGHSDYCVGADALKFWLMPFVCFLGFGFPGTYGSVVSTLCGFAPLCFYILCGFFTLSYSPRESEKGRDIRRGKLTRAIRRSGLSFAALFAVYLAVNLIYYAAAGTDLSGLLAKRVLFNFFVLSAWPFGMGESLWFIQGLFYAFVALWIIDRLGLLRWSWLLFLLCAALNLASGELSGVLGFRLLGYGYLPPNVLTTALPCMLLGMFLRRRSEWMLWDRPAVYLGLFLLGGAAAFFEFNALSAAGALRTTLHSVGFVVMALSLSCFALVQPDAPVTVWAVHGRPFARTVYALSQLVAFALLMAAQLLGRRAVSLVQGLGGVAVYPVCLALCVGLTWLRRRLPRPAAPRKSDGAPAPLPDEPKPTETEEPAHEAEI